MIAVPKNARAIAMGEWVMVAAVVPWLACPDGIDCSACPAKTSLRRAPTPTTMPSITKTVPSLTLRLLCCKAYPKSLTLSLLYLHMIHTELFPRLDEERLAESRKPC